MAKNTDIIRSDKNVSETPKKHEMWNDLTLKLVLYALSLKTTLCHDFLMNFRS